MPLLDIKAKCNRKKLLNSKKIRFYLNHKLNKIIKIGKKIYCPNGEGNCVPTTISEGLGSTSSPGSAVT